MHRPVPELPANFPSLFRRAVSARGRTVRELSQIRAGIQEQKAACEWLRRKFGAQENS